MDSTATKPSDDENIAAGDIPASVKPAAQPSQTPPPYWRHQRSVSHLSQTSLDRPRPITLRDRTGSLSSTNGALWAKSISIEDYVIVRGNLTGIGAYVVWTCKVQTLDVSLFTMHRDLKGRFSDDSAGRTYSHPEKVLWSTNGSISACSCWARYSEFYNLREKLVAAFPHSKSALPALPPKSFVCMGEGFQNCFSKLTAVLRTDRFQRKFLEKRRSGLSYFLKYVRVHVSWLERN